MSQCMTTPPTRLLFAATFLALTGCSDPVAPDPSGTGLEVFVDGLSAPVDLAAIPGDASRIVVVEKTGRVRVVRDGVLQPTPVLDLSGSVSTSGEQGLLGIAFPPDYSSSRHFFVNYTDGAGDTRIVRYTMSADPEVADPGSAADVLTIGQPQTNHNGGQLAFGPDGHLYIGMGDGGGGGDPDGNGQDLGTLLGAMLRIDVSSLPATVPPDNPFVSDPSALDEIWAYGLRNPWRFSFDPATGDLWIGDVGQGDREEISRLSPSDAGANLGWAAREGTRCFSDPACNAAGFTDPVHEYGHDAGECSVTGGHVYRGPVESLRGRYVFADFCAGWIRSFPVSDPTDVHDHSVDFGTLPSIAAFGVDGMGHLYVLSLSGTIWRMTGSTVGS